MRIARKHENRARHEGPHEARFVARHAVRFSFLTAALVPALCAQTANVNDLFAIERKQIETADFRVTGHLVAIDATGARVTYPITIKTHWFPGSAARVCRSWAAPLDANTICASIFF